MRKYLYITLAAILICSLVGCTGKAEEPKQTMDTEEYQRRQEAVEQVEKHIGENVPDETTIMLADDGLKVYNLDGNFSIQIEAFGPFFMPYIIDIVCPVIVEAVEATEYPLSTITIQTKGAAEDSLTSWRSKDGISGMFITSKDIYADDTTIPGCTSKDLYELYEPYLMVARDVIKEMGGDPANVGITAD